MREERWHRPGLVGPIILIAIGVGFLLSNLGLLQGSWWELWRLWPLLLVLIGLDILARGSRWASAGVALLSLALVAGVFYLLVTQPEPLRPYFARGKVVANPVSEELKGAKRVDVTIAMGVGDLRLGALVDSPNLLEGNLSYPERWGAAPRVTYSVSGERGHLLMQSRGKADWVAPVFIAPFSGSSGGEKWTVQLSPRVPLSLHVDAGASSSVLDLSRLQITDLTVKSGVGRMDVLFPPEGERMTARINGGVGELILRIPEGLPARITVDGGLGSVHVAPRFERHDNVYETPGYNTAESRLEVEVDGGVGSLRVE